MKTEVMRLSKLRAAKLLEIARESKVYRHHDVKFLEGPGRDKAESTIVIEAKTEALIGLAQAYLITILRKM